MDEWMQVPDEQRIPEGRVQTRERLLLQEISEPSLPRGGGRRRRLIALVAVPVVLLLAGATYLVTHRAEDVVGGVGCYAAPSLDADTAVVSSGRDPIQACSRLWTAGTLGAQDASGQAPPLVACVLPEGSAVGVFPGDPDVCSRLGLQPLPDGYNQAAAAFGAMRDDLVARFDQAGCVNDQQGAAIARAVLAKHGFTAWSVDTTGTGSEGACVTLSFDTVAKAIRIVSD